MSISETKVRWKGLLYAVYPQQSTNSINHFACLEFGYFADHPGAVLTASKCNIHLHQHPTPGQESLREAFCVEQKPLPDTASQLYTSSGV